VPVASIYLEAGGSCSEVLVPSHQTTKCHISEDSLDPLCCKNFTVHMEYREELAFAVEAFSNVYSLPASSCAGQWFGSSALDFLK